MFIKQIKKMKLPAAQAMTEFALVLPVLLIIVYGLLETGRLLFIFASVNTASRQAVRYGSAIGMVDTNNDGNLDTPRYEDCAGITAAANNVAFITRFTNINISYDHGLNSDGSAKPFATGDQYPTCATLQAGTIKNGDRINVHVSAQFAPVIPFIPLDPITIESSAARTIIGEISIQVTAAPAGWPGKLGTGTPSLVTSLDPNYASVFDQPGDVVHFIYTLKNIEPDDLPGPFKVTEYSLTGVNTDCSGAAGLLHTGESTTCTGTYTITQDDIDIGYIKSLAVATSLSSSATSNEYTLITDMTQNIQMGLQKNGNPKVALTAGDVVNFTYTISNTGNVTLTGPFAVQDDKVDPVDCSGASNPLLPGSATTCTGTYTITAGNINANSVTNYAIATSNEAISNLASFTVITNALTLSVSANPTTASAVGDVITFYYTLKNVGISDITSPFNITASYPGTLDCSGASSPIPSGGSTQCISTYLVTQNDIDTGSIINVATATARLGGSPITSGEASTTVLLTQTPALSLSISTDPVSPVTAENTLITYTYTLQNNGNVSLRDFTITDDLYGNLNCSGATNLLAPGASRTCSPATPVTHTVSAVDISNGSIINKATATAKVGTGVNTTASNEASAIIITFTAPRITLELTANPTSASPGQTVTFTFKIRNTGNTTLSGFTLSPIADPGITFSPVCNSSSIEIGQFTSCTANYTVTAADASAGSITTTWEASAPEAAQVSSSTATVVAYICTASISNIQVSGNTFYATISSNATLTASSISVTWNNDHGHQSGSDKTTRLTQVSVDTPSSSFTVSPSSGGPTYTVPGSYTPTIQNGSRLIFTFHQSYDNPELTDQINVSFSNPSCPALTARP